MRTSRTGFRFRAVEHQRKDRVGLGPDGARRGPLRLLRTGSWARSWAGRGPGELEARTNVPPIGAPSRSEGERPGRKTRLYISPVTPLRRRGEAQVAAAAAIGHGQSIAVCAGVSLGWSVRRVRVGNTVCLVSLLFSFEAPIRKNTRVRAWGVKDRMGPSWGWGERKGIEHCRCYAGTGPWRDPTCRGCSRSLRQGRWRGTASQR